MWITGSSFSDNKLRTIYWEATSGPSRLFLNDRHDESKTYLEGKWHLIWSDDSQFICWLQRGLYHRLDGPAIVSPRLQWYVEGKDITEEVNEWLRESKSMIPFTPEEKFQFLLKFHPEN